MKVSCVCAVGFSLVQTGSAFILIGAFAGAVPSNETTPLIVAAVAGSTAAAAGAELCSCPAGAGAGLLPPQAAAPHANTSAKTRNLECIKTLLMRRNDGCGSQKPLTQYAKRWY